MKRYIYFCISVLLLSCSTETNSNAPVLTKVVVAPTQEMINNGIDAVEFTASDYVRLHYTVTDKDGDFNKAVVTITDGSGNIESLEYPEMIQMSGAKEISQTTTFVQGKFTVGSWSISVFYVDKAGNKSETVVKKFTVKA